MKIICTFKMSTLERGKFQRQQNTNNNEKYTRISRSFSTTHIDLDKFLSLSSTKNFITHMNISLELR